MIRKTKKMKRKSKIFLFYWQNTKKVLTKLYKCYIIILRNEGEKMKYEVKNLRTNKIEVVYNELDRAKSYIRISVMFMNERKPLNVKRWTKRDFEIIEVK